MYKTVYRWAGTLLVASISVLSLAGLLLLLRALSAELWNEKAAGWAQAILTSLGIGFALYTARDAQRHAVDLKREELEQKRQGVGAIAEAALNQIRAMDLAAGSGRLNFFFDEDYHQGYFVHNLASLRAIPLHELLSYNMTVGVLEMIEVLIRAERFCELITEGKTGSLTAEELYFTENSENLDKATRAMTFIRGGVLGWTAEEINRRNGSLESSF